MQLKIAFFGVGVSVVKYTAGAVLPPSQKCVKTRLGADCSAEIL